MRAEVFSWFGAECHNRRTLRRLGPRKFVEVVRNLLQVARRTCNVAIGPHQPVSAWSERRTCAGFEKVRKSSNKVVHGRRFVGAEGEERLAARADRYFT